MGEIVSSLSNSALMGLKSELEKIPKKKTARIDIKEKVNISFRAWSGIVDFAEKEGVDLIVMTTQGRKGISRFFLGSVAEKVINEAPCPVMAIKPYIA